MFFNEVEEHTGDWAMKEKEWGLPDEKSRKRKNGKNCKKKSERRRGAERRAKRHSHSFGGKWQRSGGASRVEFCVYPTTRVYWPTVEPRHVSEEANQAAAAAASWCRAARLAALPLAAYWRSAPRHATSSSATQSQLQHCNHFTTIAPIATPTAGHHALRRLTRNQLAFFNLCLIVFNWK